MYLGIIGFSVLVLFLELLRVLYKILKIKIKERERFNFIFLV